MKNNFEKNYKKLLLDVLKNGDLCNNRTNIKTYKKFNQTINIDLKEGFPILTGKKVFFQKGLAEFKWIYEGKTDLDFLHKNNIYWWDDFAINGELGKVYGYQIKKFGGLIDQVEFVINEINNNSRRAVITLWNPLDLKDQALPCCYTQFNFVRINNQLNMSMNFRSSDLFLGLPYDIILGALFLHTIANKCNLIPSNLGLNLADAHIYETHKNQVLQYNSNKIYSLPNLIGNYENYNLSEYISNKFIKTTLIK